MHAVTRGLAGPDIPYDQRYRDRSNVFYRYGAFAGNGKKGVSQLLDHAGRKHKDRREAGAAVPPWLRDPFIKSPARRWRNAFPLGADFFPYRALCQRGKGGVYEALDLSVSPPRRVIIKEGRRHGETGWDGMDGYERILHEEKILRHLRAAGLATAQVHRAFSAKGNRYLVLEKISARPLLPPGRQQPARTSWQRAQYILDRVEGVLKKIHAAGLIWRDCKPSHIFVLKDAVRLIDFEGACGIEQTDVLPWASPYYTPPPYPQALCSPSQGNLGR